MLAPLRDVVPKRVFCYTEATNIHPMHEHQPRSVPEINDDLIMAVIDCDETRIARLQRELGIAQRLKDIDIL